MEENIYELISSEHKKKEELASILTVNSKTAHFGLSLTEDNARELMISRNESLKKYQRVEFGKGILEPLIETFCDSQFIEQEQYVITLERLQDIFYEFKNRANDLLTDAELLDFMRTQFDQVCFGDLDYLESTCLERFAEAIRCGYTGYRGGDMSGEYQKFDQESRWDKDLYLQVLHELFWG